MELNTYQQRAKQYATYPGADIEIAEQIQKGIMKGIIESIREQTGTTDSVVLEQAIDIIQPYVSNIANLGRFFAGFSIVGEAGEFVEKLKRVIRDSQGTISPEQRTELILELGDVLWSLSECARLLSAPLEEVARANLTKLEDRRTRGVLNGSGDSR